MTPESRSEWTSVDIAISLNLTAANRAYLMEPHWNPTTEEQALARIHRLGQMRPVATIRLVIENSIEEVSIPSPVTVLGEVSNRQDFSMCEMSRVRKESS